MGTSSGSTHRRKNSEDHPHAYGDKHIQSAGRGIRKGSSPRVWGQEMLSLDIIDKDRIIPTRMGTSTKVYHEIMCAGDHPHAYGDKNLATSERIPGWGSSPRVWGQDFRCC